MPKRRGKTPGKLGPVLRLGPGLTSGWQMDPERAQELGQGSRSVFAPKLGPGVKQMMMQEPKSVCELELGLLENLEPKGVLEPETVFELDPVVLLVLKTVSVLALESMTTSELERGPEDSLFPKNVSEMETIHQELLKLGLGSMSEKKPGLRELMKLGLTP